MVRKIYKLNYTEKIKLYEKEIEKFYDDSFEEEKFEKKIKKPIKRKQKKPSKSMKFYVIIGIFLLIYVYSTYLNNLFFEFLAQNPTLFKLYVYIENQIVLKTFSGLLILAILGTLFFLVLPSEAVFLLYLQQYQNLWFLLVPIIVFGNVLGMIVNYGFGRIVNEKILIYLFKDKYPKNKKKLEKYGGIILILGNILPGPIELLAVFYGAFKFNFKTYVFLVILGRTIKFAIIVIAYLLFWDQLNGFFETYITKTLSSLTDF